MHSTDFIDSVLSLHLPSKEYIVIGSGLLCALGIREAGDVDLVVSEGMFEQMKNSGDWKYIVDDKGEHLERDHFELWLLWDNGNTESNLHALKRDEILIDNVPFTSLERLYKWKKQKNRPKDQNDLQLIDAYIKIQSTNMKGS